MKMSSLVFTGVFAALGGFALASIAPAYAALPPQCLECAAEYSACRAAAQTPAQLNLCKSERLWCMNRFCPGPE